jgi:ABC-type phosphate transport system substrate-binding protein
MFRALITLAVFSLSLAVQAGALPAGESDVDLVVVVSRDSPLTHLSKNQVADIFLGRSMQFPDGRHAVPVDQAESSPMRSAFNTSVLGRTPAQVRAHWAKIVFTGRGRPPVAVADGQAVKDRIFRDANAIGYLDRQLVDDSVAVVHMD